MTRCPANVAECVCRGSVHARRCVLRLPAPAGLPPDRGRLCMLELGHTGECSINPSGRHYVLDQTVLLRVDAK